MSLLLLSSQTTPTPILGPLTVQGKFFRQGGERITLIESSDFSLFKRDLDGEDIRPILRQRADVGFNLLRVWLLNNSVVSWRNSVKQDGIDPRRHPDFYARLRGFCGVLETWGLHVDLTVFTQTQTLMPNRADQQAHLDQTCDSVRGLPNVIVSLVNENDQHDNATAPDLTPTNRQGVIYSAGSNGADSIPPSLNPATTDAVEWHSNDLDQWWRKNGHGVMEWADIAKVPGWTSEATRCPDHDKSEAHYEDAAAGASLLCAGSVFHSVNGKASKLFDAEVKCAQAHVRGAKSVPLEYQDGYYRHRDDLEGPNCLRAYSRTLPDGREYIVRIRP